MTITEVSEKYELTPDTLRYYERIGLLPAVGRNKSGVRNYSEEDCMWVDFIKCMRSAGISIEALAEYVSLFQKGNDTISARKELLLDERKKLEARIEALQETLAYLNNKIDGYEEKMLEYEKNLKKFE